MISSRGLKLKSDTDEKNFKGCYNDALEDGDNEAIAQVFKNFYHLWIACERDEVKKILINTDCIEFCEEEYASSELLLLCKHEVFMPRISKVFLKNGKEYLVLETSTEIQKLIKEASQK